jgi:hypothetical protein
MPSAPSSVTSTSSIDRHRWITTFGQLGVHACGSKAWMRRSAPIFRYAQRRPAVTKPIAASSSAAQTAAISCCGPSGTAVLR